MKTPGVFLLGLGLLLAQPARPEVLNKDQFTIGNPTRSNGVV